MEKARGQFREYRYADFYVSTIGNDDWSGKLPEPNADGTDGPFATVTRARDAVRLMKYNKKIAFIHPLRWMP